MRLFSLICCCSFFLLISISCYSQTKIYGPNPDDPTQFGYIYTDLTNSNFVFIEAPSPDDLCACTPQDDDNDFLDDLAIIGFQTKYGEDLPDSTWGGIDDDDPLVAQVPFDAALWILILAGLGTAIHFKRQRRELKYI
jgi:hypothetical protein